MPWTAARALALCALAAACVFASRPPPVPGAIAWRDCGGGAACAELWAPLDHLARSGAEIPLALARVPAAKPAQRIGVLFVNPGGPGVSAVAYLRKSLGRYAGVVRDRFDLVAVDARGSGGSAPLDCHRALPALLAQDPDASDDAAWQSLVAASRALAAECARAHGALLPFLGTAESARDLDWVRAALGEEQISFLGYSYGTALGATYASLFPERVRALVLDGSIDPSFQLASFAREQAIAVEGALAAYGAEAARKGWHGVETLDAVYARAAQKSTVLYAAAEGLSTPPDGWHDLAGALGAAEVGDDAGLAALFDRYFGRRSDGSSDFSVEAQLGTLCADSQHPNDVGAWRAALPELAVAAPHFGRANLLAHLPCAFWPAPARALERPGTDRAPPILVLANDADPLTPHVWGERLAARFPSATRVDVESREHTAYRRGNDCVDDLVEAYLVAPAAPARTHCP